VHGDRPSVESDGPARGCGGYGQSRSVKVRVEKSFWMFPGSSVPQTDTGGWVEYTQARE
jgi:hypothetical protein